MKYLFLFIYLFFKPLASTNGTCPAQTLAGSRENRRHSGGFYLQLWSCHTDSMCYFDGAAALRAACIWFHREVVNMPVFSTSPLFRHAQLRRSGSKVSARGCGHCRSAFTHTNLHLSGFSPQYGCDVTASVPLPGLGLEGVGENNEVGFLFTESSYILQKTNSWIVFSYNCLYVYQAVNFPGMSLTFKTGKALTPLPG